MFKVTETILDRAELVWCSVQTWVGGLGVGADLKEWRGPEHWGNRRDPPAAFSQKFQAYCWGLRNSIHIADSFTLSSSKGCFLKAYLILKDARNLFHLFQSQLLLLRGPGDLPTDQTKLTGPPEPVSMGFPDTERGSQVQGVLHPSWSPPCPWGDGDSAPWLP